MRVVGGETYIATSVSRGHSLNDETSNWDRFRQTTTRDTQLAVHTRGQVSRAGQDYIGPGSAKPSSADSKHLMPTAPFRPRSSRLPIEF